MMDGFADEHNTLVQLVQLVQNKLGQVVFFE